MNSIRVDWTFKFKDKPGEKQKIDFTVKICKIFKILARKIHLFRCEMTEESEELNSELILESIDDSNSTEPRGKKE